jgi:hypothetical protein
VLSPRLLPSKQQFLDQSSILLLVAVVLVVTIRLALAVLVVF